MKIITAIILGFLSSNLWAIGGTPPGGTVPEPETLLLIGIGVVSLMATRNKRK